MIHEETDNTPDIIKEDSVEEEILVTLRPTSLSEYIGQEKAVETLKIAIEAACKGKSPSTISSLTARPDSGR